MGVSCKESVFTVSMWYFVFLECRRFLGPDKKSSPMILVMSFVEPGKLSQFYVYLQCYELYENMSCSFISLTVIRLFG